MSNASDFVIERGILKRFMGTDTHVIVPDGVKAIGNYAFRRCQKICSVQLPDSVTKIGDYAFQDCTALEQINIPAAVESIGAEAFRNCRQLQKVTFAGNPEEIGLLAFYGCWKLIENTPEPLQDFIARMRDGKLTSEEGKKLYTFSKAKGVATIKEFDGVSMLAWDGTKYPYVFGSYENSLMIPVSIGDLPVVKAPSKQLPEDAIVYCGADQFDKLPRPNKAIFAVQWLMKDKMLREELSDKIQVFIKKYADDVAYALKSCENVAAYQRFLEIAKPKAPLIEKLVEQCSGKTEILAVLLNSGSTAKQEPAGLSLDAKPKVTVAELKKLWTYQKLLITATDETVIELTNYKGHDKHVEIPAFIGKTRVAVVKGIFPDAVESVEFPNEEIEIKCSFRNCKAMADENGFVCVNVGGRRVVTDYVGSKDMDTLIIPEGVTETAYGVFREVHAREVILPEGFIRLAGSSFADCRKLQKVTLPESLRSIEQMVFQNCGALKQLYIPEGVSTIGILDLNRTKDPSFTIYGKRGSTAHSYAEKYGTNFVEGYPEEIAMPEFQVESGVLTGYVGNGGDVVIPADVTEIGSFAFHENNTINTLKIGYQVQMIGKYAFASCTNLTSVKICGVKAIADCAFQFSRITRVEIEEGVETIGANAFGYLSPRGAEVVIPASVLSIGKDAFYSNFNTTTLYVKAGSYAETYAKENNIPFVAE